MYRDARDAGPVLFAKPTQRSCCCGEPGRLPEKNSSEVGEKMARRLHPNAQREGGGSEATAVFEAIAGNAMKWRELCARARLGQAGGVVGGQNAATVLSRHWHGRSDHRKWAITGKWAAPRDVWAAATLTTVKWC